MTVKCLLCSEAFGTISYSHLRYVHNTTLDEYQRMFPTAPLVSDEARQRSVGWTISEEHKQRISEVHTGKVVSEGTRRKISDSLKTLYDTQPELKERIAASVVAYHEAHPMSREVRQQISSKLLGREFSEEHKQKIGEASRRMWENPSYRQYMSEVMTGHTLSEEACRSISKRLLGNQFRLGAVLSEEVRQKISISVSKTMQELWKDPKFAQRMMEAQHRRPNEPELQLQSVLNRHFLREWKYTGDGSFWIEGRNPDFVNVNGRKQVIEIFGIYWHDPILFPNRPTEEELIAHYKQYGFDCLVFWEYDVWNEDEVVAAIVSWRNTL